jgi:molybdopterin synthase sulfur carrier subunit
MEWRLFADLAERADSRIVQVDTSEGASVRDALNDLLDANPELAERVLENQSVADHVNVLVNGTALSPDELDRQLESGDELALCPPVSGG